ncbi:sulfotransferase domain-containing protein [Pseudomonadota bacterium]
MNIKSSLNPDRRPNLLGIGAAKASTTWLASVLSAHPDVFIPKQKELNALHYDDLDHRLVEYEEYFTPAKSEKVRGDFSVRYLSSKNAPTTAAKYVADSKILMSVRNPVDQIQSHYWHLLRQNFHQSVPVSPRPTLFEAITLFPDLLLEPALYGKHIARWLEEFTRDRFIFINLENLSEEPGNVLNDICRFLDIETYDFTNTLVSLTEKDARAGVQPRQGWFGKAYPRIYQAMTRGPLRVMKSLIGVRRTDALKRSLKLRQVSEAVFFQKGYEKLDEEGRSRLLDIIRDDLLYFGRLTGFDVTPWMIEKKN